MESPLPERMPHAPADALVAVGLSHRTAPIDIRERFALGDHRRAEWVDNLTARSAVSECVVLSTCNRTECYLAGSDAEALDRLARDALCAVSGLGTAGDSYLATLRGTGAVRHLFRVTSGLESLIVGEPQIQGQVRGAYRDGRPTVGPVLHRLFQSALQVGGRVRADTSIASGVTSIPGAAVGLARKVFGSLDDRCVLVLGTGEMGRLTVQCLKREGAGRVFLASRNPDRAERVSRPLEALPMRRSAALDALDRVDLVIACTESEAAFLRAAHVGGPRTGAAPLVILDIAVPRNVDPRVAEISHVFLHNIDDLRQVVDRARAAREHERARAEAIIERHVARYRVWRRSRRADPAVRALRHTARQLVVDALANHTPVPDDEDEARRLASQAALNKVLHGPTRAIRWLAERSDGRECLRRMEPWLAGRRGPPAGDVGRGRMSSDRLQGRRT